MKLRIRGNSIRLRLTVSEVEAFKKNGEVFDSIGFGTDAKSRLVYSMRSSDEIDTVETTFRDNQITLNVPVSIATGWANGDETGFSVTQDPAGRDPLTILVEKDFACLKDREGEDDSDSFPHPEAMSAC